MEHNDRSSSLLGTNFVSLDIEEALGPPVACPSCHADGLVPGCDDATVTFHCPQCRRTWRPEMDVLVAVNAASQPCPPRPRLDQA